MDYSMLGDSLPVPYDVGFSCHSDDSCDSRPGFLSGTNSKSSVR